MVIRCVIVSLNLRVMPKKTKRRTLPEIKVALTRCRRGQRAVALGYPQNLGMRTKLGGEPDWIQGEEVPFCSDCDAPLTFVAQIDSVEHESDKNPLAKHAVEKDYMFGDVGMIYVFFCFSCCTPYSIHQCY
jgi:hypothetical protein